MRRTALALFATLICASFSVLIPGTANAAPKTITADADSFVNQAKPTAKSGTVNPLTVENSGASKRAFVNFPLSSVPFGSTINSVTLQLNVGSITGGNTPFAVRSVPSSWTEGGLTWNNQPAAGTLLVTTSNVPLGQLNISLPTDVISGTSVDFRINSTIVGPVVKVSSREHATAGLRPKLIVDYSSAYDCSGYATSPSVPSGAEYAVASPADNSCHDATGATLSPGQTITAVRLGTTTPATNVAFVNGTINGSIPSTWTWTQAHASGGSGVRMEGDGLLRLAGTRMDNVEDGFKPREMPNTWSGDGTILFRGVYATRVRDDVIENDNVMQGEIKDSLLDGVHTFLSEQCQGTGCSGSTISEGEDPNIYIDGALVRLEDPNANDQEGMWFKYQCGAQSCHHAVISNSVFAMSEQPNEGWDEADFRGATFQGTNNYVLWLGTGTYQGEQPAGVTFLQGTPAVNKWCQVRADWLTSHGYSVGSCNTTP